MNLDHSLRTFVAPVSTGCRGGGGGAGAAMGTGVRTDFEEGGGLGGSSGAGLVAWVANLA